MRLIIALVIIVILAVIISKYFKVHSSDLFIETPFSFLERIFYFFYNKVCLFQHPAKKVIDPADHMANFSKNNKKLSKILQYLGCTVNIGITV